MPRLRRFQPPKISDPPILVEIEWIDAQSELEFEGPAKKAGGLALLPTAGYHVRNGKHPHHGSFVVIAREWFRDEETNEVYTRDTTTIPTGWIRKWSVMTGKRQLWPESKESATSTSSTTTDQPTPENLGEKEHRHTSSVAEPSAGVNPKQSK